MIPQKKMFSILAVACVAVAILVYVFLFREKDFSVNFEKLTATYPQYSEEILQAKTAQERLAKDPSRIESYVSLGMAWKTLGDMLDDKAYYVLAREVYDKAIELTDWNNTIVALNAGSMSELLGEYEQAEYYYKTAMERTGGDPLVYQRLANLYRVQLKKTPSEILWIYDEALRTLVFPGGIVYDKAGYLVELGRYKEAIELYKKGREANPSPSIDALIKELEQKIK